MNLLEEYRQIAKQIVATIAEERQPKAEQDVTVEGLIDEQHDNYMVLSIGWEGTKRIQNMVAYVRLRSGKFWIEEDWTEEGIVSYLEDVGIPNEHIVLSFNPPALRELMESAAG